MKTDLSHYRNTALLVVNQLSIMGKADASKVARALKLSRYKAMKLLVQLYNEGLLGHNGLTLFVTDEGFNSMSPMDKIKATQHLELIHGIKSHD